MLTLSPSAATNSIITLMSSTTDRFPPTEQLRQPYELVKMDVDWFAILFGLPRVPLSRWRSS